MDSKLGYGKLDQSGRCAWQAIIAFVFDMTYYVGERDKDLKETYPEGVTSNDNAFETAFPLDCSNKTIITQDTDSVYHRGRLFRFSKDLFVMQMSKLIFTVTN